MFSIETTQDVEILRELTKGSNDDEIKKLKSQIIELTKANEELCIQNERQEATINNMRKTLVTPDQCRDIVFELMQGKKSTEVRRKKVGKVPVIHKDTDEFSFTKQMQRGFNKVYFNGDKLVHHTVRNQDMNIPINVLELLALVEVYQYRQRKLLNKDAKNFCKLYGISKVQFGKIYYNLLEGNFFEVLENIDNHIRSVSFRYQDGFIYITKGGKQYNTKISKEDYKYLLNLYINNDQPYAAIYKLSHEMKKIDPMALLIVLRRNESVSKIL